VVDQFEEEDQAQVPDHHKGSLAAGLGMPTKHFLTLTLVCVRTNQPLRMATWIVAYAHDKV